MVPPLIHAPRVSAAFAGEDIGRTELAFKPRSDI